MTNVIILHGKPDEWQYFDPDEPMTADRHWYPWLQKQLLMKNIDAVRPQVPRAFEATYEEWVREVERFDITEESILVGHSCGAGFWLRWLSENKDKRIRKLILVAPWFDPLKFMPTNYGHDLFDFERDHNVFSRVGEHIIFHSDNDQESIQLTMKEVNEVWPNANIRMFHNYGHFCKKDFNSTAFPELLDEVLLASS